MSTVVPIFREIRGSLPLWLGLAAGFFATFHLWQLALLVLSFGELPNYLTIHDWPANMARIVRMTPSASDAIWIMLDEWLIEIGSMNYAYGRGIAEWSFVVMPAKAAVVLLVSLLLATVVTLLHAVRRTCPLSFRICASVGAAGGTFIAALATMTSTWVAHCATPTWIIGLAVLGVDVATAFALQPFGGWLTLFGILLLATVTIALGSLLVRRLEPADAMPLPRQFARAAS